jgi:putative transposase
METIPTRFSEPTPLDFILEPGQVFRVGPTVFRLLQVNDGWATLQHSVSLEEKIIRDSLFLAELTKGKIVLADDEDTKRALDGDVFEEDDKSILVRLPLGVLSEAQMQHVLRVLRYIRALRGLGYTCLSPKNPTIQLDIERLQRRFGDTEPVKASWIYTWSLPFDKSGGDPRSVIPNFPDRGGKGGSRLAPEVEAAIKRVLDRKKAEPNARVQTFKVKQDVESILQIEYPNRPDIVLAPNWSSIDRRIKTEFSSYDLCRRNHGKVFADKQYRDWYPREKAGSPLAVFETDDTDTMVFLIDERSGLPSGRGHLTGTIDQDSQVVPGLEISQKPRSVWSAISAIVKAILPKDPDDPDFAMSKAGCEFYGKPGVIIFDNALYNHAKDIEIAAASIGFIPGWAKPRTPTEKAEQEGWNGRVKRDFLPTLPGYRGDKKLRDGLKSGMTSANLGLLEFKQFFMKWTYDDYSNTPMEKGLTPRQKWHVGMRFSKPRIPRDIWGYRLLPCLHGTVKFRPEGILFCGLIYSVPFLKVLRKRYGHNTDANFRFNPGDLKEIYIHDPATKAYIPIPSTNPEYTKGLSLYQHKLVRKIARENRVRNPSIPQLLLYREELRILTEQLRYSNKLRDRKRSAITGDVPANNPTRRKERKDTPNIMVVTDLEDHILDIEEVDMEEEDEGWNLAEMA